MSYRRPRNLKDQLVRTEIRKDMGPIQTFLHPPPKMGSFPCLGCVNCRLMKKGSSFQHPRTGKIFNIKHFLTCNRDWVIYLLWCPCSLYYIGETTCTLKTRLNGNRHSIRNKRTDLPVSKHFIEAGHNEWDIRCMAIDHVPFPSRGGDRLSNFEKE